MSIENEKNGGMLVDTAAPILTPEEIDAIGEVLNISMGSAATAVSTMLDRHVNITIPHVTVEKFEKIDFTSLEPAIIVKIEYVEGISGANVMCFRQSDMQVILNLLMGNDEAPSPDFVFDELSMSAACEVMNQMMGASATALSSFLGKSINISTPTAKILDSENTFKSAMNVEEDTEIVAVAFNLAIEDVMKSDFISIMTCPLVKSIVSQVMGDQAEEIRKIAEKSAPTQSAAPVEQTAQTQQAPAAPVPEGGHMGQQPPNSPPEGYYPPNQPSPSSMPPYYPPNVPGYPPQMSPQMPPQGGYPDGQPPYPYAPYLPYPPYGYAPAAAAGSVPGAGVNPVIKQPVNVQNAQFPNFSNQGSMVFAAPITSANMDLVMNVPLNVTVEIGKTKKKIKDIMDFAQGTVIELEKQAGAPVDIVVNGQLIARGDVVVIDDNFGVRVTEILGTKNLVGGMDSNG